MNSLQGIVKKKLETIFEISIDSQHNFKILKDTISVCACFFLTIPKTLRQHPILKKDHPLRYIQEFRRKPLSESSLN